MGSNEDGLRGHRFMRIDRIDLKIVRLPLVRPFQTSSSRKEHLDHILVRIVAGGVAGWGECASPSDPFYCPETTETCWHILRDFLAPAVLGREWSTIESLTNCYRLVKGNAFARSGLEMACWDALARTEGMPLWSLLGGTRAEIVSGVSLGIEDDIERLLDLIARYLEEGYRRIKLKIAPGRDIDVVPARSRLLSGDRASSRRQLGVHARRSGNAAGPRRLRSALDRAAARARRHHRSRAAPGRAATPICLDESIHSAEDARKALDLGACRVINIKVSRLGGLLEARRVHDLCRARGVPVWCGGMHEFGIGRAANVAIASLPGFTLPGDVSGSDKYYAQDIVEPPDPGA